MSRFKIYLSLGPPQIIMIKQFVNNILTDFTYFSIAFFTFLAIDIFVKLQLDSMPYRYISKSIVLLLLILYYLKNHKETSRKHFRFMIIALICFLVGDWLLIEPKNTTLFASGMMLFILGKLFYVFRFSHQRDFRLARLFPFLVVCFLYIAGLMNLIYDNLHQLFFPVIIYFFTSVIVLQFAFLRKVDVNKLSYLLVFIGIVLSILSDSITALKIFYIPNFAYEKITIVLFYGIGQYLIVLGVMKEVKQPEDDLLVSSANYL